MLQDTEEYKGYVIEIHSDEYAANPREEWDHLGTMVCFHKRYSLGDEHNFSIEDARAFETRDDIISLPLYLYDHSGLTMNTTGFSCPWDSGKVGFIFVTLAKVRSEYGVSKVGKALRAKVKEYLKGEVRDYDTWLRGDVEGYIIKDREGNDGDSCWGYYERESLVHDAKMAIDADRCQRARKRKEEREAERALKAWNQVYDKFYAPILF